MKVRILTALIGLPLLILIVWLNGWFLTAAVFLLSLIALKEYIDALNKGTGEPLNYLFLAILTVLVLIVLKFDIYSVPFALIITFMAIMTFEIFSSRPSFIRATQSVFFMIYIPLMFGLIMLFDSLLEGKYLIWIVFLAAFSTDTFAYFGGRALKGPKLTIISPNKTISGSICGFLASALIVTIYGWFLNTYAGINLPLFYFAVLGAIASIAGQIGDISASLIKRTYEVKDFGKILPGHGGIMDRFDSVIFIIPIVFMFNYFLLD